MTVTTLRDRIEKSVTINASLETVWQLASTPGWWLARDDAGALGEPNDELVNRYPVTTVEVRPQTYAAFRWASEFPGAQPEVGRGTLIELTLVETPEGVVLTVVESGWTELIGESATHQDGFTENEKGWVQMLGLLAAAAERR